MATSHMSLPTISQVRKQMGAAGKRGEGVVVVVQMRETTNCAPEGSDETMDVVVTSEVVRTGPDCDGWCGTEHVMTVRIAGNMASAQCAYWADNVRFRDAVVGLWGYIQGQAQARRAAEATRQDVWMDAFEQGYKMGRDQEVRAQQMLLAPMAAMRHRAIGEGK